jgi:hypothetical protein
MTKRNVALIVRGRGKGRPISVTAEGRDIVERMLANGCSRETVAATLGCSSAGLAAAAERDVTLALTMQRGDGALETELVGHLLAHARDGNVTAAIFLLKAKRGMRDTGDDPRRPTEKPNIVINLPAAASPEDYARMIDVTPGNKKGAQP